MKFAEYKKTKERVEQYLIKYPHLRDDDFKLIASYWQNEIGKGKIETLSAHDVLKMLSEQKLTHPESIRRSRQKLQEQQPGLRGASYKHRKKEEQEFRKNINEK